jgi:hypothetical protein
MYVLLDVKDSKASFIMDLLNNFRFVKAKPITRAKSQLLEEIKEAVDNVNLVKQGKLKARQISELIDEL